MKLIIFLISLNLALLADVTNIQILYDIGEYEKAIAKAKASTNEYSNPKLHLLWAKSAEALGRDEEAMSAYERVEILDDKNIDARIVLIKLYKRTGRNDLAQSASKKLQNYQLTPEQRTTIDNLRGINVHSFKAFASLALGSDNNINISPDELGISGGTTAISTMFSRFTGSLSYINELESKGAWYGRGDLQLYNQTNFDSDATIYDLFLASVSAGAGYNGDGYNLYVPLGIDNIQYLDKNLLTQMKIEPRVSFTISNELMVNASASYISRSYNQSEDKLRDDSSYGVGLGVYYLLGSDFIYLNAKYDSYSADKTSLGALYIDKTILTSNFGVNYNLAKWLVMRADYRFRLASYDDNDRGDLYNQVELKFSHYFAEIFEAFVSNRYINNTSDLDVAEYDKNIFMLGVSVNY